MNIVIYSHVCTPCKYRVSLNIVKRFVNKYHYSLEIRNTAFNIQNKVDAESIGQPLPFIYNADTKLSTQLLGVTNEELERIRGI